jgi:hypothetical protein
MLGGNMLNNIFHIDKSEDINFNSDVYKLFSQVNYDKTIESLNNHLHNIYDEISYLRLDDSKCQIELHKKNEKMRIIFQVNKLDCYGKLIYQFIYKKVSYINAGQ